MSVLQIHTDDQLRLGIRDCSAAHHWRETNHNFSFRSPPKKILVLPGNGTHDARAANGMCKITEELIGEQSKNYDICGFYYPDGGEAYSPAERALKLLDECLVPLIADKTPLGDLQRLSWEKACENLRNVMVVTHCYGSRIMAEVDEKLDEIMRQIGYSAEEIKDIHRQLCVFHQNNTREDLGKKALASTNMYRVTQADERNRPVVSENDSFPNYVATELLKTNEIILAPIHENEQALIVAQITNGYESEHNGAYWIRKSKKLPAAQTEEDIFKTLLQEVANSSYHIESWQQIYDNVQHKNPSLRAILPQIMEYGQEYIDDFHDLQYAMRAEYKQAMVKMMKGSLTADEIAELSSDALFAVDDKKRNLLDYAVDKGDWQTAKNLWNAMQKYMPEHPIGERLRLTYENYSLNCLEAKEKQKAYLQQALNNDNIAMFTIFAAPADWLPFLEYHMAGEKTALLAGAAYSKLPKEYATYLKNDYKKGLQSVYHRCLQAKDKKTKQKILPSLGKKLVSLHLLNSRMVEKMLQNL